MAIGMAIEATGSVPVLLMELVQVLDTASVRIWDTAGGLAAELVTAITRGCPESVSGL